MATNRQQGGELKKEMVELMFIGRTTSISREMLVALRKAGTTVKAEARGPKYKDADPQGRYQAVLSFPGHPEAIQTAFVWNTAEEVRAGLQEFLERLKTMAL